MIFYARYWVTLRIIVLISIILVQIGDHASTTELVGNCFSTVGALLLFMCFKPYIVYRALLMDSKVSVGVVLMCMCWCGVTVCVGFDVVCI